ncbi:MAG: twin-arginine translocase subunit TatC [Acidobacteria bacterium]|nr:twin-arginine translocase subunit TatC [Acidobacteriota bacterium]
MADSEMAESLQGRADNLASMSFLEHLEELRRRIVLSVVGVAAGFGVCWGFHEKIYQLMQRPIFTALAAEGMEQKLVYLNPIEPFNMYVKMALIGGLFVASPWVLYQVWCFISPGLYRHEKRYVLPFLFSTVALFCAGGWFGYRIVYPRALEFLVHFGRQFQPMITISEYTQLFLSIVLGMGAIFELPVLIFFLALMGIVNAGWMWRNFRYALLAIVVIAAIVTPTPDMINMCIFAAPMVALYLFSILIAYAVHPRQRRARAAARNS